MPSVLVVGGGPAGRALAAACAERGVATTLLDPAPDRPWRATYGAWRDELPAALPPSVVAASGRARVVALTEHDLRRDYAVLDTAALRRHLDGRMAASGVRIERGRAGSETTTAGRADLVVDAGGAGQPLRDPPRRTWTAAAQTAVGVVVGARVAEPLVAPGEVLLMDWRPIPGVVTDPATFLYGVPLGGDRVLLEETSLARRPGLSLRLLTERLRARLAGHSIHPSPAEPGERVWFPLDVPRHRATTTLGFGASAPLMHPATGYQLATALSLADPVAGAIAEALPLGSSVAVRAAEAVMWSRSARATHLLRRLGLECLLRLPAEQLPAFFEGFFRLPPRLQRDYLGARNHPLRTVVAMARLLGTTSWPVQRRLIGSSVLVSGRLKIHRLATPGCADRPKPE